MKITLQVEQKVTMTTMHVKARVRYWEDTEVNGKSDTENGDKIPCKEGYNWCPIIDIRKGVITNWRIGERAKVHYKVCDFCALKIYSKEHGVILEYDGYVPSILSPKEDGCGDYIIMDIDIDGSIDKWDKNKIYELFND